MTPPLAFETPPARSHTSRSRPARPLPVHAGAMRSRPSRDRQGAVMALAALTALGLVVAMISGVTGATWTDTTRNDGNSWATATVSLTDSLAGVAMFAAEDMVPGSVVQNSITVTNAGSVTVDVRLYAENLVNSSADFKLAEQLNLKVGTTAGGGEIFTGTLAGFAATHAAFGTGTAVVTLAPAATHTYHFWVELDSATTEDFSSGSAQVDFVWEGQSQ